MLFLLNIPEQCKCKIDIPLSKIFADNDSEISMSVQSVQWRASLKPCLLDVKSVKSETIRYEEIQILYIELNNTEYLYDIAHTICKFIKCPCLLIMHYEYKFLFGCCQFNAGKINYDNNILRAINFSHWIYPDLLSDGAKKLLDKINQAINTKSDLYDIYTQISHSIENFRLSGITRAHIDRLLCDMMGGVSSKRRDEIMKYCSPYKKFSPTDKSLATKYNKSKRTSNYTYSYDREDVWYCLLNYEPTKKIIVGRRYRDIDDLIYSIDTKLEEYVDRW